MILITIDSEFKIYSLWFSYVLCLFVFYHELPVFYLWPLEGVLVDRVIDLAIVVRLVVNATLIQLLGDVTVVEHLSKTENHIVQPHPWRTSHLVLV